MKWQGSIYGLCKTFVLWSSGISRKSAALIFRYSPTKECIVRFRWGFQQNVPEDFNQIEIWKCHMFDFRLIPLDRITYNECFAFVKQKEYFHSLKDGKFHSPRQNDTLHHSRNENILTNAFNHLKMKEKRKQTNKQQHHNHSAQWKSN